MSTLRRRRYSAAVYRRRRLVVLICTLLIAVGIWALVSQPWSSRADDGSELGAPRISDPEQTISLLVPEQQGAGTATDEASKDPEQAAESTPAVAPTPEASLTPGPCQVGSIVVEAVTDQETYAAGQQPKLSMRVTNVGEVRCIVNVGTAAQKFTVTSGRDTWWRSTDCQVEGTEQEVSLEPGQVAVSSVPVVWNRTRSSVASCGDSNRPSAPAGGASYHLRVELDGIASAKSAQFLLY